MNRFDSNCFVGNWPFFPVAENRVKDLVKIHKRYGISGGFVSSLEAIFYQDPYVAEKRLSEELVGTGYQHIMVLNPMLPAWKDDLLRCVKELNITGVRLLPGFHSYTLEDEVLDDVISEVKKYNLCILLTLRMHDDRMTWMYHPRVLPMDEIAKFINKIKDTRVLLNHIRLHELEKLNEFGIDWDNLFVDICGFTGGVNALDRALKVKYLQGHIVYGSGAPLLEAYSSVFQLETSDTDENVKNTIFKGSFS